VNAIFNTYASIESLQIRTAPKQHMLAVIDHFTHARMQVRRGSPAQIPAPFKQPHLKTSLGQRASRTHPGNAASDDSDRLSRPWLRAVQSHFHPFEIGTNALQH
jgi:hypothetical protein